MRMKQHNVALPTHAPLPAQQTPEDEKEEEEDGDDGQFAWPRN